MSSIRYLAAAGGTAVRDFLWPRRCSGCGDRGSWLCDECLARSPIWSPPWCGRCGIPTALPCHCHELDGSISGARAVGQHVEWLQRSVQLLKYRDEFARAEHLAPLIAGTIADLPSTDLIVPVPLHRKREQERGYNQALVLAEMLAAAIERPLLAGGAFVRRSNTPHQTGLSAHERRKNLVNAFTVADPSAIRGRSLLLVDDVMTSGATVGACAVSLRSAGACHVYVATVSRAINRTT